MLTARRSTSPRASAVAAMAKIEEHVTDDDVESEPKNEEESHEEDEEDSCKANPYGPQGRPQRLARVYEGVGTWFCAAVHDVKP